MGHLSRFRASVRADLAKGAARPLRWYAESMGLQVDESIQAEYAQIVRERNGATADAPPPDAPPAPPADAAPPRSASPPPPVQPPTSLASTLDGLGPIPIQIAEKGEIARGGMGAILRVHDESLRRDLAMKVVLEGANGTPREWLERFVDEAQIQAQLDHPGVAPIHHLGRDSQGRICFTMKLVKGRSLEQVISQVVRGEERANITRAVQALLRVCETVAFAHEKGVIHRDLKPENVMIGNFGEVYVMDWGLAKVLGAPERRAANANRTAVDLQRAHLPAGTPGKALTLPGYILGTPAYMPPEQADGRSEAVDARSDVYSLGAILYEVLSGHAPYQDDGTPRDPIETVRAVMQGPPRSLRQIVKGREELVAIAEKAMTRDPAGRYPSARELGDDLQRWIEGRVVRAYRTGAWAELRKWVQRNRAVAASLAGLVIVSAFASVRYGLLERDAKVAIAGERDEAVKARDQARVAARRADGLRLATIASTLADQDPTLAALLALEGVDRAPGAEALTSLYAAVKGLSEIHTLIGHDTYMSHGRWSPDGTRVYTASRDGVVIAWDAATGALLHRVRAHDRGLLALDVVGDGSRIVTVAHDGTTRVWDAASMQPLSLFVTGARAHLEAVPSPDGTRIATAEGDRGAAVWDLASGREIARFQGHGRAAGHVAWSPDGTRIASGGADLQVRVWEASTGREVLALPRQDAGGDLPALEVDLAFPDRVPTPAWSGDGRRLVTWAPVALRESGGHWPRRVRIWDAQSGRAIASGPAETGWTQLHGLTPDGASAVVTAPTSTPTTEEPHRVVLVDLADGRERVAPWAGASSAHSHERLRFRPDGGAVAFVEAGYGIGLWSTETGAKLQRFSGHRYSIADLAFSPDGRRLLTCANDRTARIWDAAPAHERRGLPSRVRPERAPQVRGFDAAGRLVAVVWRQRGRDDGEFEVVDAETGATAFAAPTGAGSGGFVSPDGRRVAVTTRDRIEVIDLVTRRTVARIDVKGPADPCFDATGRFVALHSSQAAPDLPGDHVYVYDLERPAAPRRLANPEREGGLHAIAWNASGTQIAAPHHYSGPIVWDVATGDVLHHFGGHTGMILSVAFSPDGRLLASEAMDATVRVWDLEAGLPVARCPGVPMTRTAVLFSPDSRLVLAAHPDAVHVFDSATGRELGRILAAGSGFSEITVTPEGRLGTLHADGTVRLWPFDPAAWLRRRLPRELAVVEADQYAVGTPEERLDRELRRVLAHPTVTDLSSVSRRLLEADRMGDAADCAARALALGPDEFLAHFARARIAARAGDYDAAFASMRRAVELGLDLRRVGEDPTLLSLRADPRWKSLSEPR